jgi:hypothetical protein
MYPLSYFFLMGGAIYFLINSTDDVVYDYIVRNLLPLNYIVMCTIELLLCFEMQLIYVKITSDDINKCKNKIKFWKIFRFVVLLLTLIFNLL